MSSDNTDCIAQTHTGSHQRPTQQKGPPQKRIHISNKIVNPSIKTKELIVERSTLIEDKKYQDKRKMEEATNAKNQ